MRKLILLLSFILPLLCLGQHHMMYVLSGQTSSSGGDLTNGLISCWEFDEASGTSAVDATGYYSISNALGTPTRNTSGLINTAYNFTGDYMGSSSTYSSLASASAFTVSSWIKNYRNVTATSAIFCSYPGSSTYRIIHGYQTGGTTNDILISYVRTSSGTVSEARVTYSEGSFFNSNNAWNLIVTVYDRYAPDGNRIKLYVNNSLVATGAGLDESLSSTSGGIRVGQWGSGTAITAIIDQIAVWGRALTETEISTLYNSGNGIAYINW